MKSKIDQKELNKALLEVRKAYRIIYEYQKRVLDLVKYISKSLGYQYAGGWSKFSSPSPKNGKGSLDNWAWDWLRFLSLRIQLQTQKEQCHLLPGYNER
ncbi:MAG: hypothetical protein PQJ59_02350 [Spirochaetales bacterium]|nr:hypothetical protein [Spirochaetales bacterium]